MAPDFVRRNFRLRGTLELHRRAVGRDLLRAPANIALAGPNLALEAAARLAPRGGDEGGAASRPRLGPASAMLAGALSRSRPTARRWSSSVPLRRKLR
ncbi:MAG: hypothetical protein OXE57_05125, partial [Alphaproteobacteria bacterium]|nr:hypothetical protein [Alphaproteobacteria bacterium]